MSSLFMLFINDLVLNGDMFEYSKLSEVRVEVAGMGMMTRLLSCIVFVLSRV